MNRPLVRLGGSAAALGALGSAIGAALNPEALLAVYLPVAVTLVALAAGALGVLMLSYLVRGSWTEEMHRPLTAAALTMPLAGLLLVPILLAMPSLYPWAAADVVEGSFKQAYLAPWFFVTRSVVYILVWTVLAVWAAGAFGNDSAMRRVASVGLIVFALTGSFAGLDWLQSIDPKFHSSIYGLLFLTSQLLAGYAFGLLALLAWRPPPPERLSGYGAVLIATLLLWAYNHAMQYIIFWSGNLPDEVIWYVKRTESGWEWLLWGLVFLQFVVPFFALLSATIRSGRMALMILAAATLALRFAEAFLLSLPDLPAARGGVLLLDIPAAILLLTGLWLLAYLYADARMVARYAPRPAQA